MLTRFLRLVAFLGLLALPTLLGPDPGRAGVGLVSLAESAPVAYGPCHDPGHPDEASLVHAEAAARLLGYRPGAARQKVGESPRPAPANALIPRQQGWPAPSALAAGPASAPPAPPATRRTLPLLI